ncbi:uncharacterized protein LOC110455755 isoform X2 [Mizuhopecten yessoensis]|uniref:Uncharacterized protein n=1 Tax=Mizuhopecten yessoensis TaxID=6573 RepID=A0A210QCG7_MIZYE|nr:uncharacterized protein LOC110455755 isoform X2 [Mizuhopecten yessoensis]OWF46447.1 hypothetical protein KP79_PYT09712 [Mizuhopecten yessoensis]
MDSNAIFSPKHPGLRTYGCRTKNQDRPRGILIQKKQNKLATSKIPENTNFSLSDDSNDLQEIKDNKRKAPSTIQRKKGNVTPKQRQPRKTDRGRVAKKQLNTSLGENAKQRKEESQPVQEMKSTPKHGLEQANQVWVKTKVRGSDSDEDSIELPRRDQDMTWQEKISLLMPKMTYKNQHQPDRKGSGIKSGCQMPGYLNLSAEEVMEEDDESSDETDNIVTAPGMSTGHTAPGMSKGHSRSDLLASRLSLHSPSTLKKTQCIDEKQENKKEHLMSPIDPVTSEEFTYTYEWVTDTGGSRPGSHQASQVKGRDHTSQTTTQSSERISSLSKENVNRKSSSTEQTNSDAYTYDWVTDSGTGQTGPATSHSSRNTASQTKINSCPSSVGQRANSGTRDNDLVRISQNSGRSETKHTKKDRWSHGYLNSTKRPGALSIFQANFPVDLSVITSSLAQGKERAILCNKASPITAGSDRQVQRMNSTRRKDGLDIDMMKLPDMSVIERICPVEKQPTRVDHAKTMADKVPYCLSSTKKNGGLDFDKANFSLDVSEIKELSCVEDRQGHIQLVQEKTPKARQTKPDAVTPMKSVSVINKKKRRLLPKSSTVLFVSSCTEDLINPTPSLSAILSSQNTVNNSDHLDITRDGPVKKAKTGSGKKHLYLDSGPNSIWKEKDSVNSGKILTSTPVASTQTRFQRPEVNLTCVPRPCFEDELEFNESIEVNSDEIVPEDFTEVEEDISVENLEKSGGHQKSESNSSSSKIDFHEKPSVGSALQTSKTNFRGKLSVKPITKSSTISKMTECCLLDPSIVFPRRKYTSYRKISEEMFKDRAGVSEDILFTHNFKRR